MQRNSSLDTVNKVAGIYKVNTRKIVKIVGLDADVMLSSENMVVDGADNAQTTSTKYTCQFATATSSVIPPFCTIIAVGPEIDVNLAPHDLQCRRTSRDGPLR
jgi:hypothetical protein